MQRRERLWINSPCNATITHQGVVPKVAVVTTEVHMTRMFPGELNSQGLKGREGGKGFPGNSGYGISAEVSERERERETRNGSCDRCKGAWNALMRP